MLVFFSVLYNPVKNSIGNISRAGKLGIKSIVYLNSVSGDYLEELKKTDAHILGNNQNMGLGEAFHEFEQFMIENDYSHFIYFDQDTIVEDGAWKKIATSYKLHFSKDRIGMLHYSSDEIFGRRIVINSGCLFSMDILKKLGFHDRSYFVEGLDYEFCLRLKINGYNIATILCNGIDHKSLQDGFSKRLFSYNIPLRLYGKNRIRDFNRSHIRLILISLQNKELWFFYFFLKSLVKMNIMEIVSKLIKV